MKRSETALLLAMAAAWDRRTVGDADINAWHKVLESCEFEDAQEAVTEHYSQTRDFLMPADVLSRIKATRAARLARPVEAVPDADPDDVKAYQGALRAGRFTVASDRRPRPALPAALKSAVGRPIPAEAAEVLGRDPERRLVMSHPCPFCQVRAWQPCVIRGGGSTLDPPTKGKKTRQRAIDIRRDTPHPSRVLIAHGIDPELPSRDNAIPNPDAPMLPRDVRLPFDPKELVLPGHEYEETE